jgi:hypothetical protein
MNARSSFLAILVATALLAAAATSATAAIPGLFLEQAARALPRARPPELRLPQVRLTSIQEARYGISDDLAIARLDDAKAREQAAVDSAVAEVAADARSSKAVRALKDTLKDCSEEAFKKAAEDYAQADQQGSGYPAFNDTFFYFISGCLSSKFPYASEDTVDGVANFLTGHVSKPAHDAVAVAPATFANWLDTTGDEVATATPGDLPERDPGGKRDDSGGSWSVPTVIVIAVGVLAIGGFVRYRRT